MEVVDFLVSELSPFSKTQPKSPTSNPKFLSHGTLQSATISNILNGATITNGASLAGVVGATRKEEETKRESERERNDDPEARPTSPDAEDYRLSWTGVSNISLYFCTNCHL